MITDYYSRAVKRRAKEPATEQVTPQDKERLQITPTTQETHKPKTKSNTGGPRQTTGKQFQFQRSKSGTTKKNQSKTAITTKKAAGAPGKRSDTVLHRQAYAWQNG
jgi:hypothetical protein